MSYHLHFLGGPWDGKEIEVSHLPVEYQIPFQDMLKVTYLDNVAEMKIVQVAVYKFIAQRAVGGCLMLYTGRRGY